MALDTIPKQEGGKLKAVASGTLPNGKPVVVNADGTVSVVSGSSQSESVGALTVYSTSSIATRETHGSAYDPINSKLVIGYRDDSNSSYGTVIVGTVSGTSISFGSPVVFHSAFTDWISVGFDSSNSKFLFFCRKTSPEEASVFVGTVSGTSISFGSASSISSNICVYNDVVQGSSGSFQLFYKDISNNYGYRVSASISGTSVSLGSPTAYNTNLSARTPASCYDSSNNRFVTVYQSGATNYVIAHGLTSGVAFYDSNDTANPDEANSLTVSHDASQNANLIFFQGYNSSTAQQTIESRVAKLSGGSFTIGALTTVEAPRGCRFAVSAYDETAGQIVVLYTDSFNGNRGTYRTATIDGTAPTFSSSVVVETGETAEANTVVPTGDGRVVMSWVDDSQTKDGTSAVLALEYNNTNLTSENYIGMSTGGTVADTGNTTIDIVGTVNKEQSGLTPGQQYYVQTDGTIGTTPADPSVLAGTAVSATKMVVKS